MNSSIAINRGVSRCLNAILSVSLNMKSLYWSNFLKQVYGKKYIINIDESGFSNSSKQNYSWFPRGRSSTVINDVFRERINLIHRVSQKGDYLGLVLNNGITSKEYWLYLMILSKIFKSLIMNIRKEAVIIQD